MSVLQTVTGKRPKLIGTDLDGTIVAHYGFISERTKIAFAAFITKVNRPRESNMAGRVSNLTSEPITPLIRPNNKTTHRYVQAPPFTVNPVIKVVAAQKANAPETSRIITGMVCK